MNREKKFQNIEFLEVSIVNAFELLLNMWKKKLRKPMKRMMHQVSIDYRKIGRVREKVHKTKAYMLCPRGGFDLFFPANKMFSEIEWTTDSPESFAMFVKTPVARRRFDGIGNFHVFLRERIFFSSLSDLFFSLPALVRPNGRVLIFFFFYFQTAGC